MRTGSICSLFILLLICLCPLATVVYGQGSLREIEVRNDLRIKRVNEYTKFNKLQLPTSYILTDVINGIPVFLKPFNREAGTSVSVDSLRNGLLGLNLKGEKVFFGVWDSGNVRATHVELSNRVTNSGSSDLSDHATHVSGTIAASGVNERAMGMAPLGKIRAWDFDNDTQEMLSQQSKDNPVIVSNHSYGTVAGWDYRDGEWSWFGDESISESEDWKFGFYNQEAADWDQIAYSFPHYLIVKSAGNDRGDVGTDGTHPADGPFDIISFTGTAKNIITVGAVEKFEDKYERPTDVIMSSFSGWGPTDDGRIKPDIVAPGVGVYSSIASSDEAYASQNGTSMSAPVVTGVAGLLQELYNDIYEGWMWNSSIKGLLIHTADEAGPNDGPDYKHGWGMLNAANATHFLLNEGKGSVLKEMVLNDGQQIEIPISPSLGTNVKVTIAWSDLPGTPVQPALDPTNLMLVNDLDLRVSQSDELVEKPWVLDPAFVNRGAQRADNFRDNVEQVVYMATEPGSHTVTISHKGNLSDGIPQRVSVLITYMPDTPGTPHYWVGKSGGDWADEMNWASETGGTPGYGVPSVNDQAVIDNNSFNEGNSVVTLSGDVEVGHLSWVTSETYGLDLGGHTLSVYSGIRLQSNNINLEEGVIAYRAESDVLGQLVLGSGDLSAVTLIHDVNGTTTVNTDLSIKELIVTNGELVFSDATLELGTLRTAGANNTSLSLDNSTLVLNTLAKIENSGFELVLDESSSLSIAEGNEVTLDVLQESLSGILDIKGNLTLNGPTSLDSVYVAGSFSTRASLTVNGLNLQPGATLNVQEGSELTVIESWVASGTDQLLINVTSGTEGASVIFDGHIKVCFDFWQVSNVSFAGDASLTIGENSSVSGIANNWYTVSCDFVPFADFSFQYGCVNSLVEFTDKSSGEISSWSWSFSDGEVLNGQDVTRVFEAVGDYDVTLSIQNASLSSVYTTAFSIAENNVPENSIVVNEDLLASRRGASNGYQWYKNGEPIDGATAQTYNTDGEEGVYYVVTYGELCNRVSESVNYVVTSIDEPSVIDKLEESLKISPNPASDYVEVEIAGYALKTVEISLVDLGGKQISAHRFESVNSENFKESIALGGLTPGIYLMRISLNEEFHFTRRVILAD